MVKAVVKDWHVLMTNTAKRQIKQRELVDKLLHNVLKDYMQRNWMQCQIFISSSAAGTSSKYMKINCQTYT